MSRRGPSAFLVHLTVDERDVLLAHVVPRGALDHLLKREPPEGMLLTLHLTSAELDEFMELLEATANTAQNLLAQRQLDEVVQRLTAGLSNNVDPGAHLVRPAAIRVGYTPLQGQYLAFILYYETLHGRPPAEEDLRTYFHVSPPTVHQMLGSLERKTFIARTPGRARSIRLLLRPEQVPLLQRVERSMTELDRPSRDGRT